MHDGKEERDPPIPIAMTAYGLQPIDIVGAMLLDHFTDREIRTGQEAPFSQKENDDQSPEPPITVFERVNRLELVVQHGYTHKLGYVVRRVVHIPDDILHKGQHLLWRRRYISRLLDTSQTANPVLYFAELSRGLAVAACAFHQECMELPDQLQRQRSIG